MCRYLLLIVFLSLSLQSWGDDSIPQLMHDSVSQETQRRALLVKSMPHAVVLQDSAITALLDRKVNGSAHELVEMTGFRVQVYSSNRQQTAKNEAMLLEKKLASQLDVVVYVQYLPPFWKVRLGDFRTQEEAQEYKMEFLKNHPELQGDTYVVRDQIKVIR